MWEELYEDHYKELVAYGTRMSGSKELAEDLVQETFVKALMNTETVADLSPSKQRAWLFRTFKNLFFDRYRRAVLESEYEQNWQPEYIDDPGMQEIENAMLRAELLALWRPRSSMLPTMYCKHYGATYEREIPFN